MDIMVANGSVHIVTATTQENIFNMNLDKSWKNSAPSLHMLSDEVWYQVEYSAVYTKAGPTPQGLPVIKFLLIKLNLLCGSERKLSLTD